jgi:hypothetical protein
LDHPARKQRNFESFEHSSKRALLQIKFLQWRRGSNVVFRRLTFHLFAPASADPASGTALALSLYICGNRRSAFILIEPSELSMGRVIFFIILSICSLARENLLPMHSTLSSGSVAGSVSRDRATESIKFISLRMVHIHKSRLRCHKAAAARWNYDFVFASRGIEFLLLYADKTCCG